MEITQIRFQRNINPQSALSVLLVELASFILRIADYYTFDQILINVLRLMIR
jgi:hypothetical protein